MERSIGMMQAILSSGYKLANVEIKKTHSNIVEMNNKRDKIVEYINNNIGTAKTVSAALGMVKSTAHNHLTWLAKHGKIMTRKITVYTDNSCYPVREYYAIK